MREKYSVEGYLQERADDSARTVTTYDEHGNLTETRPYTPDENAAADARAESTALSAVDKLAAIEAAVLATVDLTAKPWTPVTGAHDAVPPLAERIMDDGHTYRNVSGQWLSHSPY